MIRINLLPHREHRRRQRRQQFFMLVGAAVVAGLVIGLVVHLIYAGYIESQENKNNIFKTEIAKLDTEIAEIRRLKDQIDALLARKQVIENLQSNRAETVNLFNELAAQMPEGVALKSIKQNG
ncbi:MAG: fimbrial protein, partial [Rhodocyclaceae bacterium]|nr:fimbrial protein [Rhodocyclaceae bacterium]